MNRRVVWAEQSLCFQCVADARVDVMNFRPGLGNHDRRNALLCEVDSVDQVQRLTDTALDTIRPLEVTVQGFEERAGKVETDISDAHKRAKELEAKVGAQFEDEER